MEARVAARTADADDLDEKKSTTKIPAGKAAASRFITMGSHWEKAKLQNLKYQNRSNYYNAGCSTAK